MNWEIVCFDLDNTLFDYEQTFQKTMEYSITSIIEKYEMNISIKEWFPIFKTYCDMYWPLYASKKVTKQMYRRSRLIDSFKAFNVHITTEDADYVQSKFADNVTDFVTPYLGMKSLLEKIDRTGQTKLGIISNGNSQTQLQKIKRLDIGHIFPQSHIFISEALAVSKPSPQIFHYAKKVMGVRNSKCLYIGDSWELDMVGAKTAGWDSIFFNTRGEKCPSQEIPVCTSIACLEMNILHKYL